MRRFLLTYRGFEEQVSIEIEAIQFSSGSVVLELYPHADWTGPRGFFSLKNVEYTLAEFGDISIKWLDMEQT